jgi:DNA repair protein RadC
MDKIKEYKTKLMKISLVREPSTMQKVKISSSLTTANYIKGIYEVENDDITLYESFYVVMLNNANNTIGYTKISQGGITGTVVDVRLIAKHALECLATSVILIHNHPSGNSKPSSADKLITEKIKHGLALLDIRVLDHIILTENTYFSFADECLL